MKKREPSLSHYIYSKLKEMIAFGESKHGHKQKCRAEWLKSHGTLEGFNPARNDNKIFSVETKRTYTNAGKDFVSWCKKKGVNRPSQVDRNLGKEYLVYRNNAIKPNGDRYSAWTVSRDMSFLNKVFKFNFTKSELGLRERKKEDIKRGRDRELTQTEIKKNYNQINIVKATGCRKASLPRLRKNDFVFRDKTPMAVWLREKGGKRRLAPVLPQYRSWLTTILDPLSEEEKVFGKIDKNIGYHVYRKQYANNLASLLQKCYAENGEIELDGYDCRHLINLSNTDQKNGEIRYGLNKEIAGAVSGALGHNRLDVLASYLAPKLCEQKYNRRKKIKRL